MDNKVLKIEDNVYLLDNPKNQAIFQIVANDGSYVDSTNNGVKETKIGKYNIAPWGRSNNRPNEILKLVRENHIKPQLIYTSRDFLLGSKLALFQQTIDNEGKEKIKRVDIPEIDAWLKFIEAQKYMRKAAYNMEFFHNVFTKFSVDKNRMVDDLQCFDATMCRAEVMKNGRINNYFVHPDWTKAKDSEIQVLPSYLKNNPTKYWEFMYHGRDEFPSQPYYDIPPWWGTEEWTNVSNLIPKFHKSGLLNGYNIKYLIKIPQDYFLQYGEKDAQEKAEKKLREEMNTWLAGVENNNKALVAKFGVDQFGNAMPGFDIIPVEDKNNTEAYAKVNDQSNIAHTSGHGIDPSLAGIDTGGKLGGSGSEKRISYQLHIALRTPQKRDILLEPFEIAFAINGWNEKYPGVFLGFKDIEITTLDQNPTGQQKTVNQ